MSAPRVTAVAEASPAAVAGLRSATSWSRSTGEQPRDVIEYQQLIDAAALDVVVRRRRQRTSTGAIRVRKEAGEPLGLEVSAAVFDRVRTCDNHCAFCFIYQLPKGMRRSLYLKDDDYRLSFLYGNFTTLTRFTELDAERVIDERLGPLFVSIHATDPEVRAAMLRNPRGATSLRWLRVLLDAGIEVHGQVVVCPGVNDGAVLEDTLLGVLDQYPALATVGVVPLGLSRFSNEPDMRPHTRAEAAGRLATVGRLAGVLPLDPRPPPRLRLRRVLPDGRRAVPRPRRLRGLPPARERDRHGPGVRRRLRGRPESAHGRAARLLRLGRRRPGRGLPGADHRARAAPSAATGDADDRPIAVLTGTFGARGPGPAAGRPPADRRADGPRSRTVLRRHHRRRRAADRGRPRPGAGRPSPRTTATCCPTPASPRAGSSTARPPTSCPARSRSWRTDGWSLRCALDGRPATGARAGRWPPCARAAAREHRDADRPVAAARGGGRPAQRRASPRW